MSVDLAPHAPAMPQQPQEEQYRALSSAAVASLVVGFLSSLALLDWVLALVPVVGMVLGITATRIIARRGGELTGRGLAWAGTGLSAAFLVLGVARLSLEYATEVPEGYTRISYSTLQPDPDNPDEIVPPAAEQLNGQRVFIKGYPLSGAQRLGIKQFVLVRDQGQCCFGGAPKLTDQIAVTLSGPLSFDYDLRMLKLAGTFHVHVGQAAGGPGGAVYSLEADHLQ